MAGSIGIKQANGDFYSILDDNATVQKRLILTTVHDNQKSVQIDLYRSLTKTMTDAMYIGSIVVENVSQKPKGEPSIEMILSSTRDGSVSAHAVDLGNPENKHHLSISLKSLEEDKNEYQDFDLETSRKDKNKHIALNRKFPWLVIIIIGIVLILLCLGLWFFLFRSKKSEPVTQISVSPPSAQPEQQTIIVTKPPQPQQEAAPRQRPSAPEYIYSVPEIIPPEGIAYKIRRGDTLWDISEAFYRNPRLYPFIVRSNGIYNPNLIVSGTELNILPIN